MFNEYIYKLSGHSNPNYKGPLMGIEVEAEAINYWPQEGSLVENKINFVKYKDDSLRNNGVEFITRKPTIAANIIRDYEKLQKLVKECKTKVIENSPRVSTHVHLNFSDQKLKSAINFILTSYILEDHLFKLAGNERIHNHFCLSLEDAEDQIDNFYNLIELNWGRVNNEGKFKYCNINIVPIAIKNSIEIRSLKGWPSVEELTTWLTALTEIYNFSTYENLNLQNDILGAISGNDPNFWLSKNFPTLTKSFNKQESSSVIYKNLRNIQPHLYEYLKRYEKETLRNQKAIEAKKDWWGEKPPDEENNDQGFRHLNEEQRIRNAFLDREFKRLARENEEPQQAAPDRLIWRERAFIARNG